MKSETWKVYVGRQVVARPKTEREARRIAKEESRKRKDYAVASLGRFEAFYLKGRSDGVGFVIG